MRTPQFCNTATNLTWQIVSYEEKNEHDPAGEMGDDSMVLQSSPASIAKKGKN
jgi:hypothetical protein